jgi:hypothetical protein
VVTLVVESAKEQVRQELLTKAVLARSTEGMCQTAMNTWSVQKIRVRKPNSVRRPRAAATPAIVAFATCERISVMVCTDFAPVVPKTRASIVVAAVEIAVVADAQD